VLLTSVKLTDPGGERGQSGKRKVGRKGRNEGWRRGGHRGSKIRSLPTTMFVGGVEGWKGGT
jgi:hypothetical protein